MTDVPRYMRLTLLVPIEPGVASPADWDWRLLAQVQHPVPVLAHDLVPEDDPDMTFVDHEERSA